MNLPGEIQSAPPGLKGFDTDTPLSAGQAEQFFSSGYRFCVRYLSLRHQQEARDLSADEALAILRAGLALMAVQHVRYPGWTPSASLGSGDGNNAARNARAVGLPAGINLWCDLEGVKDTAGAQEVIDYCNAWYDAVSAAGYVPGLYVGYKALLNGDQLYHDLEYGHYWKSASGVPAVPVRGYQLVQSSPNTTVDGVAIDEDTTQTDDQGGQVQWLIAGSQAAT